MLNSWLENYAAALEDLSQVQISDPAYAPAVLQRAGFASRWVKTNQLWPI